MKKFFYIFVAIICISLSFPFSATNAVGQTMSVRFVGVSGVWPIAATSSDLWVLNTSGWHPMSFIGYPDPPVPVSDIVCVNEGFLITSSGEGFYKQGGHWQSLGFTPGGATPTVHKSLGQLKSLYR